MLSLGFPLYRARRGPVELRFGGVLPSFFTDEYGDDAGGLVENVDAQNICLVHVYHRLHVDHGRCKGLIITRVPGRILNTVLF